MGDRYESRAYGDPRLGAFIREVRQRQGVSQLELGRAAGVSEQLIGAIERGDRAATSGVRVAIASRLGVSLPENDLAEAIERLIKVYEGTTAA
mgnify:CR=1 FL=1